MNTATAYKGGGWHRMPTGGRELIGIYLTRSHIPPHLFLSRPPSQG
jgi:hypothetical protein